MAQGELPWAALLSEDLCRLPLSSTSFSHTVQQMCPSHTLRARSQVSVSDGARCEFRTVHNGLNKLWGRKGEREKGEGDRRRGQEGIRKGGREHE